MKTRTLLVLAGLTAPMILTESSSATFTGLETVTVPHAGSPTTGLLICRVYAVFDAPGDALDGGGGTPGAVMNISVLGGGTFYNHAAGGDFVPSLAAVTQFPELANDTFATIGATVDPVPGDFGLDGVNVVGITPLLFTGSQVNSANAAWGSLPTNLPSAQAFGGMHTGSVLLFQLATADGEGFSGDVLVTWRELDGQGGFITGQEHASFHHVPAPGSLALLALAGVSAGRRRRRRDAGRCA